MSATLPPYSAFLPEVPPAYTRGNEEEAVTRGESPPPLLSVDGRGSSEADHAAHDPSPSLLNRDVRITGREAREARRAINQARA